MKESEWFKKIRAKAHKTPKPKAPKCYPNMSSDFRVHLPLIRFERKPQNSKLKN